MNTITKTILPLIAVCIALSPGGVWAKSRGEQLFKNCEMCHGVNGGGNQNLGAPAIAGMEKWHIESALLKFKEGKRGKHYQDIEGMKMRPMARTLSESDIPLVAEFVSKMPKVDLTHQIKGDPSKGEAQYALCSSCHGVRGEGKKEMNAPALVDLQDWYLKASLLKFKKGIRGDPHIDPVGAAMGPMANLLQDEAAIHDVIDYILALQGKRGGGSKL